MAAAPRISVALCTYNGERFVAEQLRSILGQSLAPGEVIVSDDGSVDGTLEAVEGVTVPPGTAIVLLDGETGLGVTGNFERAVSAAGGELIALSDQDDRWHPDKLARLSTLLAGDERMLLVHTDARLIDDEGRPTGDTLFRALEVTDEELEREQSADAFGQLLRRNLVTGATVVFRRRLLDAALPFPREWVHDEWLAAIAAATVPEAAIGVSRDALIDYRQHGGNAIGVAAPTLRYKISRVLESRGDRNAVLAAKFAVLADRLDELEAPPERRAAARAKARFEARRAALPGSRLRRLGPVVRLAVRGEYGRFASRGRFDILRDLLQKP